MVQLKKETCWMESLQEVCSKCKAIILLEYYLREYDDIIRSNDCPSPERRRCGWSSGVVCSKKKCKNLMLRF